MRRGNPKLHVTSTGCDDGVAVSLCAGSLNALALHGFLPRPPMSENDQVVLVGGGNPDLQCHLLEGLCAAGFDAKDASPQGAPARRGARRQCPVQHRQPHPARHGRAAGAQQAAARCDVHRAHPRGAQAHHHRAVLDLRRRRAATRSTGSKPGRSRSGPTLNAGKMTRVKWGAGNNGVGNRVRPSSLLNTAWQGAGAVRRGPGAHLSPRMPASTAGPGQQDTFRVRLVLDLRPGLLRRLGLRDLKHHPSRFARPARASSFAICPPAGSTVIWAPSEPLDDAGLDQFGHPLQPVTGD